MLPKKGDHIPKISGFPVPYTRNRSITIYIDSLGDKEDPGQYIRRAALSLREVVEENGIKLSSVHVACFGGFWSNRKQHQGRKPVYGVLTNVSSYRDGWNDLNIHEIFSSCLGGHNNNLSLSYGTDVDAAAFGEFLYEGRRRGFKGEDLDAFYSNYTLIALNFSRSINGGIVRHGELWEGASHPLMSAIRPRRFTISVPGHGMWTDLFQGDCIYHQDCIEGLIGVSALEARADMPFTEIPPEHPVWEIFAYYAAQLCITLASILSPSTIVLMGRSTHQTENSKFSSHILKMIRNNFYERIGDGRGNFRPGYEDLRKMREFIRMPTQPERLDPSHPKGGLPGRHGALRLAAADVLRGMEL